MKASRPVLTLMTATALSMSAFSGLAQDVVYVPSTAPLTVEQERQVERIGMKIHCPICSGESIAQSQTDISRNMMNEVRALVSQGKSEEQILNTFAESYGPRILLEPPKRGLTSLLWTLPVVFLVLGALWWWTYLQRASRAPAQTLSAQEEQRIEDLLAAQEQPGAGPMQPPAQPLQKERNDA